MTALAYGVHETLVREKGLKPDTEEYYAEIDATMRMRFPEYFDEGGGDSSPKTRKPAPNVVAPAGKVPGQRSPKKVVLTQSQVRLARRLGLQPEQYAKQLMKESL